MYLKIRRGSHGGWSGVDCRNAVFVRIVICNNSKRKIASENNGHTKKNKTKSLDQQVPKIFRT